VGGGGVWRFKEGFVGSWVIYLIFPAEGRRRPLHGDPRNSVDHLAFRMSNNRVGGGGLHGSAIRDFLAKRAFRNGT